MAEGDRPDGPPLVGLRLGLMFFLQWATWGVWVPVLGRILKAPVAEGGLGFSELQIGLLMGLPATLGALAAPFLAGQLADRWLATEKALGLMELLTASILWILAAQKGFWTWMALMILGSLVRTPTVALANALAFAHLADPRSRYPRLRAWGTIGWIAAGWGFAMVWLQTDLHFQWLPPFLRGTEVSEVTRRLLDSIRAGSLLSIVFGLYCFTLPHTPPKREGVDPLAFRKAFKLFRRRSFAVLMAVWLIVASVHSVYFIQTSKFLPTLGVRDADILPAMSIGQFAEILVMVALGFFLKRLGFRAVLTIGAFAYVARFAIFGTTSLPVGVIVGSQALHGVCFACFYAAAFIYVDRLADEDIRASAQTLVGIMVGIGPVLGGLLSERLAALTTPPGGQINYSQFWYGAAAIAVVATVAIGLLFRDETSR